MTRRRWGTRVTAPALLAFVLACPAGCRKGPAAAGETLTISTTYELDTLDPHKFNRLSNLALLEHFYESLVASDAAMTIHPNLATRWDNPDLLTWVFHLRTDVRFHDGSAFDSEDVVWSIERLLAHPSLGMSSYATNVASVRALDRFTVEVTTKVPMAILLNKIRFLHILRKGSTDAMLDGNVNGTGPYRFVEWQRNVRIEMARNDDYRGALPAFAGASIRLARGPADAVEDFRSGRSDFIQSASREVEAALARRTDVTVVRNASIFVKALGFDLTPLAGPSDPRAASPFRDPRVRRAISLAIDRPALAARQASPAVPASQLVPPFIFGYNPAIRPTPRDLAASRTLLRDAGFPAGLDVTLHTRRVLEETANQVAAMLAETQIRTTVIVLPDDQYFAAVRNRTAAFYLSRYGCPTGDASDILDNIVHSSSGGRGRTDGQYANPLLDSAIDESASVLDMSRRRVALQRVMSILSDDVAWVPLYVDEEVYAFRKTLAFRPRNDNFLMAFEVARAGTAP